MEGTREEKEDVSLFPVILLSLSRFLFLVVCFSIIAPFFPVLLHMGPFLLMSHHHNCFPGEPKAVQHGGLSPSGPHAGAHLPSWAHCEFFLCHHLKKIWSETGHNSSAPFTKRKTAARSRYAEWQLPIWRLYRKQKFQTWREKYPTLLYNLKATTFFPQFGRDLFSDPACLSVFFTTSNEIAEWVRVG